MQTEESIQAAHHRQLLRTALPLVPAWLVGGTALLFSSAIWIPIEFVGEDGATDTLHRGWMVLAALLVGTAIYAVAPLFGAHVMARSDFSWLPVVPSSDAQAGTGTSFIRVIVLVLVYLFVFGVLLAN